MLRQAFVQTTGTKSKVALSSDKNDAWSILFDLDARILQFDIELEKLATAGIRTCQLHAIGVVRRQSSSNRTLVIAIGLRVESFGTSALSIVINDWIDWWIVRQYLLLQVTQEYSTLDLTQSWPVPHMMNKCCARPLFRQQGAPSTGTSGFKWISRIRISTQNQLLCIQLSWS